MSNNKMIRTAKTLDLLVNIIGKLTVGLGIAALMAAFLLLVSGDKAFSQIAITLDLDFIKLHLNETALVNGKFCKLYIFTLLLGGGIICFLLYYISIQFRQTLSPMKEGRPFEAEISRTLRKIGWLALIEGLLSELLDIISNRFLVKAYSVNEIFTSAAISKTEFSFSMDFGFVLTACVIFFLSYIFAYGHILQQDSDETL